ncbi:dTDP-glucose 4,6-dehydratase [Bryobacterales bacterium F-183]|nr:dTDP-glucose 4,6-dehydratase [Bryobacterales bacterium F-183]
MSIREEDFRTIAAASVPWHFLRDSRLLITGANGFLPSYMVETALHLNAHHNAGIQILALVRDRAKAERRLGPEGGGLRYVVQDVREPYAGPRDVDFIVHAASQASPKYLGSDPVGTFEANVFGTRHMLELARDAKVQSLLYFSSGEVYGSIDPSRIPTGEHTYGELDPLNVRCSYGEAKRAGESLSICWWKQYGVPVKIVRPFHTYGPGMALDDGRIFADLVADVVARRNLTLKSDGLATRAFCYLADATVAFFKVLLEGENGQAYNVGSPYETSIRNLAGILCGLHPERGLSVEFAQRERASTYLPSTISRSCPDIARLRALGWEPGTSVEEGFRRTIQWAEEQEGKQ